MTIDERLEFLSKAVEFLNESLSDLHSSVTELHSSVTELHGIAREHTRSLQIDAENIRALATIAAAHEQRIDSLENPGWPLSRSSSAPHPPILPLIDILAS